MQKLLWISDLTLLDDHIKVLGTEVVIFQVKPEHGFTRLIKSLTEPHYLTIESTRYKNNVRTLREVCFKTKSIKDILTEIVLPSLATDEPFTCVSTMLPKDLQDELHQYLTYTSLPVIELTTQRIPNPTGVYDDWEFTGWTEIVQLAVTRSFPSQS